MLLGALSREPSSLQHVPELGEIRDRVGRRLGKTRAAELESAAAALDLGSAVVYTLRQIDVARRDPDPRSPPSRGTCPSAAPAALSTLFRDRR